MRPSSERLAELRSGLMEMSERMRKVARGYAAEIGEAGHPVTAAGAIDRTEEIMLRHHHRMNDALSADALAGAEPERTAEVIGIFEGLVRDCETDLRALDGLGPVVESVLGATARGMRTLQ